MATGTDRKISPAYAWYSLGILILVYVVNFIDRQILSIMSEDVKNHFQITDAKLGFLYGTAFAIFYSIFGIPLGRLADNWNRTKLIGLGLIAWSFMTTLSGFASTFSQLAAARVGVAVGEAAASPAAYSMLSDLFDKKKRAVALALYTAGGYLGMGLSLPIGGWVIARWNQMYPNGDAPWGLAGWQAAFLVVGIPGVGLSFLVMSMREPRRGQTDETNDEAEASHEVGQDPLRILAKEICAILPPLTIWNASRYPGGLQKNLLALASIGTAVAALTVAVGDPQQWIAVGVGGYAVFSWLQSLRHSDRETYLATFGNAILMRALCGVGMLAFFTYGFGFWTAPYAVRTFGVEKEMAGLYLGLPGAVAAVTGLIVSGRISDALTAQDARARLYVCISCAGLTIPLAAAMFISESFYWYAILSAGVNLVFTGYTGSAIAGLQEMVPARARGTIGASYLLSSTMLGLALGPYFVGKIATVTGSLQLGMFMLLAVLPTSMLLLWTCTKKIARR